MAKDLNKLFDDLRQSRDVFVTRSGDVEGAEEAAQKDGEEERGERAPRRAAKLKPEVFGESEEVTVSAHALRQMEEQARRFPGETGGLVVGRGARRIDFLIASGPDAERSTSSWRLDAEFLQPRLEEAERRGFQLRGVWHVHPAGVAKLSGTDLAAAARILRDEEWGLSSLYMPLSVRRGRALDTKVFVIEAPEAAPKLLSVTVTSELPKDMPEFDTKNERQMEAPSRATALSARHESGAAPSDDEPAPSTLRSPRPMALANSPYETRQAERIRQDVRLLEARGWKTTIATTATRVEMTVRRGGMLVLVELPPEYPSSPPGLSATTVNGVMDFRGVPETRDWSSLRSLLVAVEETAEWARRVPPNPSPGLLRRLFRKTVKGNAVMTNLLPAVRHGT